MKHSERVCATSLSLVRRGLVLEAEREREQVQASSEGDGWKLAHTDARARHNAAVAVGDVETSHIPYWMSAASNLGGIV